MSPDHDDPRGEAPFPPANDPEPERRDEPPPPPPPPPPTGPPEVGGLPPWEDREHYSIMSGFFATVAQAVTAPGRFFKGHPVARGLLGPVSFALVIYVIASIANWIWNQVFSSMELGMLAAFDELGDDAVFDAATMQMFQTVSVFLSPIFGLINLFVVAGLLHLGVMLLVPDNRGFEATLRAVAYGTAAYVLSLVPMCGELVSHLWAAALWMLGISRLHDCGGGRAVVIVLAPLVLFACGCLGLAFMAGAFAS